MKTNNNKPKTCVIYFRVSTPKQERQGDSLEKQERICREFAERHGLEIFADPFADIYSGRSDSRPKLDEMIGYRFSNQGKVGYVIVLSIDRLSRGGSVGYNVIVDQIRSLKVEVKDTSGIIQEEINLMPEYGDIADEYRFSKKRPSKLSEDIVAQAKQDMIDDQLRRLIGRQIDLTQAGYWIGTYPYGFKTVKQSDTETGTKKKTTLAEDEKEAPFIKEIFALRAGGILSDKEIVSRVNKMGYKSRIRNKWDQSQGKLIGQTGGKKLTVQQMQQYIENPTYAEIVKKKWTKWLPIKGQFEGLVSIDTWNKANQGKFYIKEFKNGDYQILKNYNEKKRVKTKVSEEYPYKHVIKCPLCGKNFWASASKGKSGKKFPSYHCLGVVKKKSTHKHYGISAEEFNKTIEDFVNRLTFTNEYRKGFELVMKDVYRKKHKEQLDNSADLAKLVQNKRTELKTLHERLKTSTKEVSIRMIEEDMEKIDNELKDLEVQRNQSEATEHDLTQYLKYAGELLEHPGKILLKPRKKEDQQAIWSLVFEELPTYEEIKTGTPKLSLCFKIKTTSKDGSYDGVDPSGFEPLTSCMPCMRSTS